ncbi:MAG TPA: translation initiation factor IF-2 subunit alpha [Thermoplasmata archaeon]|nr:translation initiation factor IF-2 subunit alpha [Thermoplasmata archaeon]
MPLRAEFPEEGEFVVATVTSIRNFGAFVTLDEYNNREAFIHLSEVATGWVKYIRDHIREGQKIVARVLRLDPAKSQIDLSLKRINDHQRREKIQSWKNEQRATKLLGLVVEPLKIDLDKAEGEFASVLVEKYGSLFHAFEVASADPKKFGKDNGKAAWVAAFLRIAEENLTPPHVSVGGILEVRDPSADGVAHVRAALLEAEKADPEAVTVHYVGAPKYRIRVEGTQYKQAEELLRHATDLAITKIKSTGGDGTFTRT